MKKTAAHSATSLNTINHTQTLNPIQIGRAYFPTGWRIIVPVVALTAVGAVGDASVNSKPWLTLLGLVLGFMVASMLVKRQGGNSEASATK